MIKNWLLELSHQKCWYSEAKDVVSNYDVDHFRPKGKAKNLDGTERDGYWWLAFEWTNYRIAGSICNSPHLDAKGKKRGKWDYFPLKAESTIANNKDNIADEIHYLLDPTNRADPPLITFDETGCIKPSNNDIASWDFERSNTTIRLLFLDNPDLTESRKKLWILCSRKINHIQNLTELLSDEYLDNCSGPAKKMINRVINDIIDELREMVSPEAQLSSTARACLLNSGASWARRLVLEQEGNRYE